MKQFVTFSALLLLSSLASAQTHIDRAIRKDMNKLACEITIPHNLRPKLEEADVPPLGGLAATKQNGAWSVQLVGKQVSAAKSAAFVSLNPDFASVVTEMGRNVLVVQRVQRVGFQYSGTFVYQGAFALEAKCVGSAE